MESSIIFDDSLWPLLISRFEGAVSDGEYERYLSRGKAYLERGELYVSILDMARLAMPTASQRQRQLEWLREHAEALRKQVLGCAFIIHSPLIRMTLSTVFHIVPMPTPYVALQDMGAGLRWATARLEEARLQDSADRIRQHFNAQLSRRSR
jgi:hypothetical protein